MQTFLPSPDFVTCAWVLDDKRLRNQINEARTVFCAGLWLYSGNNERGTRTSPPWCHHPAVVMWRGYAPALVLYWRVMLVEYRRRGGTAAMPEPPRIDAPGVTPAWLGREDLHSSHRANLLRKDPEHYGQFGWTEAPAQGYVWGTPGPASGCALGAA